MYELICVVWFMVRGYKLYFCVIYYSINLWSICGRRVCVYCLYLYYALFLCLTISFHFFLWHLYRNQLVYFSVFLIQFLIKISDYNINIYYICMWFVCFSVSFNKWCEIYYVGWWTHIIQVQWQILTLWDNNLIHKMFLG